MPAAVATSFKMHGLIKPARAVWIGRRVVASFVGPLVNLEFLATKLEHFRHEGCTLKLALVIECPQNFFLAANLYPVSCFQSLFHLRSFEPAPLAEAIYSFVNSGLGINIKPTGLTRTVSIPILSTINTNTMAK